MSARKAWDALRSLLEGAKGPTIQNFEPVETGVDDVPIRFWVLYSEPGSTDCENLNQEIQSFGYKKLHVEGAKWYYGIPKQPDPDPPRNHGAGEQIRVTSEDVREPSGPRGGPRHRPNRM